MRLICHLHSKYSYDSFISISKIARTCLKNQIDIVCLTDHDTIKGSVELDKYVKKHELPIKVVIGAEYYTNAGDIIGLFLNEEIKEKDAIKLIDKIHEQNGLAILPHPFQGHTLSDNLVEKCDAIEIFNSRCSVEQNQKAYKLALKFKKPTLVASDAHLASDIIRCVNETKGELSQDSILNTKTIQTSYSSKFNFLLSQMTKAWKYKDVSLLRRTLKSLMYYYLILPLKKWRQ